MSVIIKGMKLPKNCDDCRLRIFAFNEMRCRLIDENVTNQAFAYKRHPNCPLVEIPTPHGRLIDVNELKKNMRNYYPSIDHLCRSQHVVTKRDIDCATTIIEAEVE